MLYIPWGSLHPVCNKQKLACKVPRQSLDVQGRDEWGQAEQLLSVIRTNKQPEIILGILQERSKGSLHPRQLSREQVKRVVCTAALHLTLDSTAHHDYMYIKGTRDRIAGKASAAAQDQKDLTQFYYVLCTVMRQRLGSGSPVGATHLCAFQMLMQLEARNLLLHCMLRVYACRGG